MTGRKRGPRRASGPAATARTAIERRLRRLCLAWPETDETAAFGHPNFRVARKTFAVPETYKGEYSLAVRVGHDGQRALLTDPRFYETPYVGRHGWVSLRLGARPDWALVEGLLLDAYRNTAPRRALAALEGGRASRSASTVRPRRRPARKRR